MTSGYILAKGSILTRTTSVAVALTEKYVCFSYIKSCWKNSQCRRAQFSSEAYAEVELTSNRYPKLKRNLQFQRLTDRDLQNFEAILSSSQVITDADILESSNTDWLRMCRGTSGVLLRPRSTEEVSRVLSYCKERRIAVCPQGGNTGLVGGSVPVFDEIILSLSSLDSIKSFDETTGIINCEAGCILENLDKHAAEHGFTMPIDIGSKSSCQIGGNISTNAGGIRLLRYGSLHGNVLGLKCVLADGTVVDTMSKCRKDNTGYALKNMFIGSEGTLGVVTGATVLCPPRPNAVSVAFLSVESFQAVLRVLARCRTELGEILSAFETLDAGCVRCVEENLGLRIPLASASSSDDDSSSAPTEGPGSPSPYYVVVETSGSRAEHDVEKLHSLLDSLLQQGTVSGGCIAQNETEARDFWRVREEIALGLLRDGYCYKYDLSVPVESFYSLVDEVRVRLTELAAGQSGTTGCGRATRVVGYGHLGDGNLHLNVTSPSYDPTLLDALEPFVFEWTAARGGSISAEHGLGLKKRDFISFSKSHQAVEVMKSIKQLMDPHGILNPYKTIPE